MALAALAIALAAIAAGVGWHEGATAFDQAVLIARYTARVSLGLFLVAFVLGPARRDWLIAFILAHLTHFAAMLVLGSRGGVDLPWPALIFGCLAYAAPVAVLIVPGRPEARWRWGATGFVWLSFALTYWHRLFDAPDRRSDGVIAFALLMIALMLRLVAARRVR